MKVIFLDIDGVLVTERHLKRCDENNQPSMIGRNHVFDPVCVTLLNRLIAETDAKIVVSSVWRYGRTVSQLQNIFNERGVVCEVVGVTLDLEKKFGQLYRSVPRGVEIAAYLERHKDVDKWCILDDDEDFLEEQLPYFVNTDFIEGFAEKHLDLALSIFEH